jgi:hypothetical protein
MRKKQWKPGVVWTGAKDHVPVVRKRRYHAEFDEKDLDHTAKSIVERGLLHVGNLFFLRNSIVDVNDDPEEEPPPYPYTRTVWGTSGFAAPRGAAAVYAGSVRVEEISGTRTMRVLRHTFIVGGGRRILSLNNVIADVDFTP